MCMDRTQSACLGRAWPRLAMRTGTRTWLQSWTKCRGRGVFTFALWGFLASYPALANDPSHASEGSHSAPANSGISHSAPANNGAAHHPAPAGSATHPVKENKTSPAAAHASPTSAHGNSTKPAIHASPVAQSPVTAAGKTAGDEIPGIGPLTMRYAVQSFPTLMPVQQMEDPVDFEISGLIFETLFEVEWGSEGQRVMPLLAADAPSFDTTGKTATIPIRTDVFFHDGKKLTAPDVVASLNPVIRALPGVKKITLVPPHSIRLELQEPDPELAYRLAHPWTRIVPANSIQAAALPEDTSRATDSIFSIEKIPPGTGPFRIESWSSGRHVNLVRFKNFHPDFFPSTPGHQDRSRLLPLLDRWEVFLKPAQATEANWDLSDVAATPTVQIPSGLLHWVGFNFKYPALKKNPQLKQQLVQAISTPAWAKAAFENATPLLFSGKVASGKSLNEKPEISHTPAQKANTSKEIATQTFHLISRGDRTPIRNSIDFLHNKWKELGIDLQSILLLPAEFDAKIAATDRAFAMAYWMQPLVSPSDLFFLGPSSRLGLSLPWMKAYQTAIQQWKREPSTEKRLQLRDQLLNQFQQDGFGLVGFMPSRGFDVARGVRNLTEGGWVWNRLKYVTKD